MQHHPQGFVAVISVLLITTALLVSALSLSYVGYVGRMVLLDSQSKEQSLTLAEGCVSYAIAELARNHAYAGPTQVTLDSSANACQVASVAASGDDRTITTTASVNGAVTRMEAVFHIPTLAVTSWNEVP